MFAAQLSNIRFTYDGAHWALDGIDLAIQPGEFVCIIGENGSGKSTLAKHLNALLVPDEGTVRVFGLDTADPENLYRVRSQVGMVFQNPDDQLVSSVIEDDVAFGPENMGLDPAEIRERVSEALETVGLQGFETCECHALSGGQKQRVAIAGALAMKPQMLVLDEASAMLDPRGRADLSRLCRQLNAHGIAIVLVTHYMEEAAQADRVVVMNGGRIAAEGAPAEILTQSDLLMPLALEIPFAARLTGSLAQMGVPVAISIDPDEAVDDIARAFASLRAAMPRPDALATSDAAGLPDDPNMNEIPAPLMEFDKVSFSYEPARNASLASSAAPLPPSAEWGNAADDPWALRDISFSLYEGDFFGIAGHTGSGKSTLVQLANGLLQPTEGSVRLRGQDLSSKKAAAEARRNVGVVFQYPEHQLFAATVFDDVAFGPRNLGLSPEEVELRVTEALLLVHLDPDEMNARNPFSLSGGQQRRVAFAGVLAMRPDVLVLDEPMAGLDPRAKQDFLHLLEEFHDEHGLTVVVVSHDMDDLARVCNRMLVLNQGRRHALDSPARVFAAEDDMRRIGLGVPQALRCAHALRMRGVSFDLRSPIPSVDELAQALACSWKRFAEQPGPVTEQAADAPGTAGA